MSERGPRYSVAELLDLAHSPLVVSPDGFTGINPEWLECGIKRKPQRADRATRRTRDQDRDRRPERHERNDRHDRHERNDRDRHDHRLDRDKAHKLREPQEEDGMAPEPSWDDVSEPWAPDTEGNGVQEFEQWKARQRQVELREAGFADFDAHAGADSTGQAEPTKRPEPAEHSEAESEGERKDRKDRQLDMWTSSNISFSKAGGTSRFSFTGRPANPHAIQGSQPMQVPPAMQPMQAPQVPQTLQNVPRGATPDANNDDFFNSLLNRGPVNREPSVPPGLTTPMKPSGVQPSPSHPPGLVNSSGQPLAAPPGLHPMAPPGLQTPQRQPPNHQQMRTPQNPPQQTQTPQTQTPQPQPQPQTPSSGQRQFQGYPPGYTPNRMGPPAQTGQQNQLGTSGQPNQTGQRIPGPPPGLHPHMMQAYQGYPYPQIPGYPYGYYPDPNQFSGPPPGL